uniref:Macaca fascicularis brain cDNA, clone: QtrA-18604 n=1 Tax=Macaca fascicularis TaxID=9541 RepID=I7GNZ3_MACFA|nr:unnamed protein product [Macaca fascicularis]
MCVLPIEGNALQNFRVNMKIKILPLKNCRLEFLPSFLTSHE